MAEFMALVNESQKEYIVLDIATKKVMSNMLQKVYNEQIWEETDEISTRHVTLKYLCQNHYVDITYFALNKLNNNKLDTRNF